MKGKSRENFRITNNGEIFFTYEEAERMGIRSSRTFSKIKKELIEEKGFIDLSHPGGYRDPALYSISERWRNYGTSWYTFKKIPESPTAKSYGFKKKKVPKRISLRVVNG